MRLALAFILALPGLAQAGGVAQLALAQELFALGKTGGDPLVMLTAAKLAGAVDVTTVARKPETSGEVAADQPDTAQAPADAAAMLAEARASVAPDETLAALLAEAETGNALVRAGTVSASLQALAAGQTDTWHLPFDGGIAAELAVLGDGDGNLDVTLTDAEGRALCQETGPADRSLCGFLPVETGFFILTVTNPGPGMNSYLLLTN
ncbi:hypothetical protein [Rhodobacter ferrooxidans]|uniref:Peptidase C-terminal archaeal/bacterial domain-containing protein n=1 Tax=Rhodobacter ferrooxidans TaxID=371731 RepID=C8S192_9RHOB|nr:hypothetical protein [Rhodobacter sp. SW2]EEW25290.1 hypothetical protein Rsw2DRAFT_1820 [Rhodobacter sp. SW2]